MSQFMQIFGYNKCQKRDLKNIRHFFFEYHLLKDWCCKKQNRSRVGANPLEGWVYHHPNYGWKHMNWKHQPMVIQKKYIASRKGHIVVSAIMNVTENLDFLNMFKPSLQDKIELAGLLSCFSTHPDQISTKSSVFSSCYVGKKHPGHAVVDNRSTHLRTCTLW